MLLVEVTYKGTVFRRESVPGTGNTRVVNEGVQEQVSYIVVNDKGVESAAVEAFAWDRRHDDAFMIIDHRIADMHLHGIFRGFQRRIV